MQAFKYAMEEKTATKGGCMYFLERYTREYTQDILQSLHMIPERGFETAETLIQEHFGNETKLTAAYMEKVLTWPAGETENVCLPQGYALFLCGSINAIHDLQDMRELDMSANLKIDISLRPFKLREWFRS